MTTNSVTSASIADVDPVSPDKVLLVESSRALASALLASLGDIDGVSCVHAGTLRETRRLIAQHAGGFFVAVACLSLPDAANGEVVDLLQRAGLPVIVLTADIDNKRRSAMFDRGVADYVIKDSFASIDYLKRAVVRMHLNRETCVLVVDDSQAFRDYTCGLLQQHGYQTLAAASAAEGIAMLRTHPRVRVVVTDYHMPGMNGVEMVRQMRTFRSADDLAIIAISQSEEAGVLAQFLKSGANDYLRKPFGVEEFFCRVDQNIDMQRAIRDARRLAERDFLTGLYNRRSFFERAGVLFERATRGEIGLLVAMIDIDHFKRINDTYGHHAGDEALKSVADCLARQTGDHAILARFGGEEFAFAGIVDENIDAQRSLEAMRRAVSEIGMQLEAQAVPITVSIGASQALAASLDGMLLNADRAVYQAKAQGRDRVVIL